MLISRLHKVGENSVFYSTDLSDVSQEYYEGLVDGSMIGYATDGSVMEAKEAYDAFLLMCDYMQEPLNTVEQMYRNIKVGVFIAAVIRAEITLLVDDGTQYLMQLMNAVNATQVGMLQSASQLILMIEPNEVLTTERLERWSDLALTADAVKRG